MDHKTRKHNKSNSSFDSALAVSCTLCRRAHKRPERKARYLFLLPGAIKPRTRSAPAACRLWRLSLCEDGGVFGYVVPGLTRGVGCAAGSKALGELSRFWTCRRLSGLAAPGPAAAEGPCQRTTQLVGPAPVRTRGGVTYQ